jgi:mannitol-specific phosphotransferase system IIBC component
VLCQAGLADRARQTVPGKVVIPFKMFLGDPVFNKVVNAIKNGETIEG